MDSSVARSAPRLDVLYDDEADVLYVSLGAPRPADTLPGEHGLLIRKDLKTGEVVGVTILDYEQHFRRLKDSIVGGRIAVALRSVRLPSVAALAAVRSIGPDHTSAARTRARRALSVLRPRTMCAPYQCRSRPLTSSTRRPSARGSSALISATSAGPNA